MKTQIFIRQSIFFLLSFSFLISCKKDLPAILDDATPAIAKEINSRETTSARVITRTVCFAAIARINACNGGEDILFGGKIEIRENITEDNNGTTHITRHFLAKEMTGRAILATTPLTNVVSQGTLVNNCTDRTLTSGAIATNKYYTVQGGAEMFSIEFPTGGSPATPTVLIHHGTLVFVNNSDNTDRVVARHTRIVRPGQTTIDTWDCGGQ